MSDRSGEMSDAPPGIGHNNPPSVITPVEVTRGLSDRMSVLLSRRDELLAGVERFKATHRVIETEDVQRQAGDFVTQITAAIKQARDGFTVEKKPWLEGSRAVDAFFKAIAEPLERGVNEVRAPMTAFALRVEAAERARLAAIAEAARVEAERVRRELWEEQQRDQQAAAEAARLRRAEEAPTVEDAIATEQAAAKAADAANARAADLTRTRGDLGSVSSLRETWDFEVTDLSQVPVALIALDERKVRELIRKGHRTIPGLRVFSSKHIVSR